MIFSAFFESTKRCAESDNIWGYLAVRPSGENTFSVFSDSVISILEEIWGNFTRVSSSDRLATSSHCKVRIIKRQKATLIYAVVVALHLHHCATTQPVNVFVWNHSKGNICLRPLCDHEGTSPLWFRGSLQQGAVECSFQDPAGLHQGSAGTWRWKK